MYVCSSQSLQNKNGEVHNPCRKEKSSQKTIGPVQTLQHTPLSKASCKPSTSNNLIPLPSYTSNSSNSLSELSSLLSSLWLLLKDRLSFFWDAVLPVVVGVELAWGLASRPRLGRLLPPSRAVWLEPLGVALLWPLGLASGGLLALLSCPVVLVFKGEEAEVFRDLTGGSSLTSSDCSIFFTRHLPRIDIVIAALAAAATAASS